MSEKKGKAQRVILDQVKSNAGDSSSGIAWRYLGGRFENGRAVGTVTINAGQLLFALSTKARVSELARLGKLSRRSRPICCVSGTSGDGYWPAGSGSYSASRATSPNTTVVCKQGQASSAVVKADDLAAMMSGLKDEI